MIKKKEIPVVVKDPLTQTIDVKRDYTDKEIAEFGRIMAESYGVIARKQEELKEFSTVIKAAIEEEQNTIGANAVKIREGYERVPVVCSVVYENGQATFTNKQTGEIVLQRPITEEEQLRMSTGWKDAEEVIREDSEKE